MSVKNCPTCSAQVPASADRCKVCFHEFRPRRINLWPLGILAVTATMFFVMGFIFLYKSSLPISEASVLDAESKSIMFVTRYTENRVTTDQLEFSDVVKLEHVSESGEFRLEAVTESGERRQLRQSNESLYAEAENYGRIMEKPVERVGESEELKEEAAKREARH